MLSFGEEAEEEEEELDSVSKCLKVKKSAHDIGDPRLAPKKAEEIINKSNEESSSIKQEPIEQKIDNNVNIEEIKSKLKKKDEKVEKIDKQKEIIVKMDEKEQKK